MGIPNVNKEKLDKFKTKIEENLKKQTEEEKKAAEKATSGNPKQEADSGVKMPKNLAKEFEDLKKDFKNTIFQDFIYQVKDQNFLFGFQLDSKTRLDYGRATDSRFAAILGTRLRLSRSAQLGVASGSPRLDRSVLAGT